MKHLDEGALRRLYDDPLAVSEPDRAHFAGCADCSHRFDVVAADARRTAAALEVTAPPADPDAAWTRFRSGPIAGNQPRSGAGVWRNAGNPRLVWRPAAAVAAAAVAIVALAVTGAAQQLFTVMQPTSIQVVPVTTSELQAMPDLRQFGTVHWSGDPQVKPVADAATAAQAVGFSAPQAAAPAGVTGQPQFAVLDQTTATFTFNASMAQAWAAAHNVTLPAMPAGLDGSSLELTVGPAVVQMYASGSEGLPQLAVGRMRAPVLRSTGPSVKEIEDYLLSIPGFPPNLAAQIRALGDPTTTLPLPVPVDRASTQQVDINGASGVLVGDDTGLGAGTIWESGGYVYGVAGTQPQDVILSLARSIH